MYAKGVSARDIQDHLAHLYGIDVSPFRGEKLTDFEYEAKQWIHSIVNDTEPLVKPREAMIVSQILEAVYQSAETGKIVYFDQE